MQDTTTDAAIHRSTLELVATFGSVVVSIQEHRNKRLAHADVRALSDPAYAVPRVTFGEITAAIDSAFTTYNGLVHPIGLCHTFFDSPIVNGSAVAVPDILRAAERDRTMKSWLMSQLDQGAEPRVSALALLQKFHGW